MTNIHEKTGIRFGYISAHSLDPDIVHELMYSVGTDLSYLGAVDEIRKRVEREADNLEENCRIGLMEVGGWVFESEFEAHLEKSVEEMYSDRGCAHRDDFVDSCVNRESEYLSIEEPIIEGTYQGVHYQTSWLGGALHFWIFESPVIGLYELCSPCVPGAGNLDCPSPSAYETYDVPAEWRVEVNYG